MDSIGEGTKSFINCSYPLAGSSVYMSNMAIRDIKFHAYGGGGRVEWKLLPNPLKWS